MTRHQVGEADAEVGEADAQTSETDAQVSKADAKTADATARMCMAMQPSQGHHGRTGAVLNATAAPCTDHQERESSFLLTKRQRSFDTTNNGEGPALHLNGRARPPLSLRQ